MTRIWSKAVFWLALALLGLGIWSCRPREVVVEKPVTRVATRSPATRQPPAVATVEKTVLVTEKETVQVVVTSTPTPIPEGGFVTRTTFVDAKTLNPILADDDASRALCMWMFEGLLTTDPFTGELEPNFAEGWTISEDGLTYTFTLRKGLQWSDGEPITAHDFEFTYAALKSGKLDTLNNRQAAHIQQIEVIDDDTVAVTFSDPDCANLESLQLGWLPMHAFTDDIESYDFAELATHGFNGSPTAFSGPFILKEWVRGDHWTQVRNERYWRGAPHLDGIVTRIVSGQAEMVQMLKSGEVDIGTDIRPQYLPELELEPDMQIFKFLSDSYDFIAFQLGDPNNPQPRLKEDGTPNEHHGEHPILTDKQVRQAIAYALDRTELVAQARLGQGIPLQANVLPSVSWAYNTELQPRAYSVDMANQLLDEAGWLMNDRTGVRSKNGIPLHLRLYTNSGNEVRETMAALIQSQLAEVGIEVEVIAVEWDSFLDVLFGQTFDMALISWSHLGVNPDDGSFWSAEDDVPGKGNNFVSYYNPELEAKLAQARTAPACDQDTRTALYREIQAQLYEDQPYCWLDVPRNLVVVNKRVGGVNPGPWNIWYNVHEWFIAD